MLTGHVVALKIINLDTEDDDVGDIQKEIAVLQQLMWGATGGGGMMPNVTKYYGSMMDGPKVWIIMEYAEGGSIRTLVGLDSRVREEGVKLSRVEHNL
jgi:protein-serine/threonine kinase